MDIDESSNKLVSIKKFNKENWEELLGGAISYKLVSKVLDVSIPTGSEDEDGNPITIEVPIFAINLSDIENSVSSIKPSMFWHNKLVNRYNVYVDITNVWNTYVMSVGASLAGTDNEEMLKSLQLDSLKILVQCEIIQLGPINVWDGGSELSKEEALAKAFNIEVDDVEDFDILETTQNLITFGQNFPNIHSRLETLLPNKFNIVKMNLLDYDIKGASNQIIVFVENYGHLILNQVPLICEQDKAWFVFF